MARRSLRDQILRAGLPVLFRCGYHAASVRDICAAAGAPQGSFTNHFRSKEAFAVEVDSHFDATELAEFLLASWEGAILRMKVERSPAALERFKTIVFETVFQQPRASAAAERQSRIHKGSTAKSKREQR